MNLITIDPGVKTGVASFEKGSLVHCGLLKYDNPKLFRYTLAALYDMIRPNKIVVEIPRVYDRRLWKGDPNDLIRNALIAGIAIGIGSKYCVAEEVHVSDWKGQRPKKVDNEYTRSKLTTEELVVLHSEKIPKTYIHNVLDAIGIGLWKLERR